MNPESGKNKMTIKMINGGGQPSRFLVEMVKC